MCNFCPTASSISSWWHQHTHANLQECVNLLMSVPHRVVLVPRPCSGCRFGGTWPHFWPSGRVVYPNKVVSRFPGKPSQSQRQTVHICAWAQLERSLLEEKKKCSLCIYFQLIAGLWSIYSKWQKKTVPVLSKKTTFNSLLWVVYCRVKLNHTRSKKFVFIWLAVIKYVAMFLFLLTALSIFILS